MIVPSTPAASLDHCVYQTKRIAGMPDVPDFPADMIASELNN